MRKRTIALFIFLGLVTLFTASFFAFVHSRYFAKELQKVVREQLPHQLGIDAAFSDLGVLFFPPGISINDPSVTFREGNSLKLPPGNQVKARKIELTFQVFQLFAGEITVNAVNIVGADINLILDRQFFESPPKGAEKKVSRAEDLQSKRKAFQSFVKLNFRSVNLLDSALHLNIAESGARPRLDIQLKAKELTVAKSMFDFVPSFEIFLDLENIVAEVGEKEKKYLIPLDRLKTSLELQLEVLKIRDFSAQMDNSFFSSTGVLMGNFLDLKGVRTDLNFGIRTKLQDFGVLKDFLEKQPLVREWVKDTGLKLRNSLHGDFESQGRVRFDVARISETLGGQAEVRCNECKFLNWEVANFKTSLEMKNISQLQIQSLTADLGAEGKLGKIELSPTGINLNTFEVQQSKLKLTNLRVPEILGPLGKSLKTLHLDASGEVPFFGDKNAFHFAPHLKVHEFRLGTLLELKDIPVRGTAHLNSDGIVFQTVKVELPENNTALTLNGPITKEGLNLDVRGPLDLRVLKKLAGVDIQGQGNVIWSIKGPTSDLKLSFDLDLRNAVYLNLNLGRARGKVIWNDKNNLLEIADMHIAQGALTAVGNGHLDLAQGKDDVEINIDVTTGTFEDSAVLLKYYLGLAAPWYPVNEVSGSIKGPVQVRGKLDPKLLSVEGDFTSGTFQVMGEIFHSATYHAGYRKGGFVADNVEVVKRSGRAKGFLHYTPEGILSFDAKSANLNLNDIDLVTNLKLSYSAPLSFQTKGEGKIGELKSETTIEIGAGYIRSLAVAPSNLFLKTNNGDWSAEGQLFQNQATLKYNSAKDAGKFKLTAQNLDLRAFLLVLNSDLLSDPAFAGKISGSFQSDFPVVKGLDIWHRTTGRFTLNEFWLAKTGRRFRNAQPWDASINNGQFHFENWQLTSEDGVLTLNGTADQKNIDLKALGQVPLGLLEFVNPVFSRVNGAMDFNAHLFGAPQNLGFDCHGKAEGAQLRLSIIEQTFEDTKFLLKCKNNEVTLSDASSKIGGGQIGVQGQAKIYTFKAPDLSFLVDLMNPKFQIYPFAYLRSSGRISIKGTTLPYNVSGSLNIAEALITQQFGGGSGAQVRTSQFLPEMNSALSREIRLFDLNLDAVAEKGILIRNSLVDTEAKCRVTLMGRPEYPRIYGNVDLLHGRLFFKDSVFQVQNAKFNFSHPSVIDPEIDLSANTEVKGYKLSLFVTGRGSNPKLSFRSQPQLSQEDIVNLLTLGVTSSNYNALRSKDRDAYTGNEAYGLLFNQSEINKGLKDRFGVRVGVDQAINNNNMESIFRPSNDPSVNVAPRVYVQKEIVKNLNAKVGSTVGVGDTRQQDLNLEYRLGRNTSVLGVYEDQRGATPRNSRTSLGVDLKFRWNFK